jgi:hypothetical protein
MNRNFTSLVIITLLSTASYTLAVQPVAHPSLENPQLWRYGIDPYGSHAHYGDQLVEGGIARIAFNRPEVRNAFRPRTLFELQEALIDARSSVAAPSRPQQADAGQPAGADIGDQCSGLYAEAITLAWR